MSSAFEGRLLSRHSVSYFRCESCGFLRTERPYWLEEAYGSAIATTDTGLLQRNLKLFRVLSPLLFFLFGSEGKYLDVAGGYGLFTRLMRDVGFDFFWTDKYCANLLSRGFEFVPGDSFSAITAFEVLEHLEDPLGFLLESLSTARTKTILFSTELFEGSPPPPSWWYYAFETGQHISFFQPRTLRLIAEKLGLNFFSHGSIHMFTDKKMSPLAFKVLTDRRLYRLFSWIPRLSLTSRVIPDHFSLKEPNDGN